MENEKQNLLRGWGNKREGVSKGDQKSQQEGMSLIEGVGAHSLEASRLLEEMTNIETKIDREKQRRHEEEWVGRMWVVRIEEGMGWNGKEV